MDISHIKLLAFDMDGTALDDMGHVTERTRLALQAVSDTGIMLVPATGRGFSRLREDTLGITDIDYAISANGAILYDYAAGIERLRNLIPYAVAADLIDGLARRNTKIYLQLGDDTSSYFGNIYDFELFARVEQGRVWRDNLEPILQTRSVRWAAMLPSSAWCSSIGRPIFPRRCRSSPKVIPACGHSARNERASRSVSATSRRAVRCRCSANIWASRPMRSARWATMATTYR